MDKNLIRCRSKRLVFWARANVYKENAVFITRQWLKLAQQQARQQGDLAFYLELKRIELAIME